MVRQVSEMTSARLKLRLVEQDDIYNIYRGLSHPAVIKHYGVSFFSLEATQEQMQWYADLLKTGTGIWWVICRKDKGTFLGAGGFHAMSNAHKKAEIGFWLLPEYWGKGYMQEAFPLICAYGFNQLDLNRIEGIVETENLNCKTAIEKLGFKNEGTLRQWEIKDGVGIDVDVYARLRNNK